jgi:hypothetical protein
MKSFTKQDGAGLLSAPFFKELKKKNPVLYGKFYGNCFRSTMPIISKITLIEDFLARGDILEFPVLVFTFQEAYDVKFITRRNLEWQARYDRIFSGENKINTNIKNTNYEKSF